MNVKFLLIFIGITSLNWINPSVVNRGVDTATYQLV
jgi:hypothetical protein